MTNNIKPTRVQFYIGKTASLDLQEWAENQNLPISQAIKEALEHFVRLYGTQDVSSQEVRAKLMNKTVTSPPKTAINNNVRNEENTKYDNQIIEDTNKTSEAENEESSVRKVIDRGEINLN